MAQLCVVIVIVGDPGPPGGAGRTIYLWCVDCARFDVRDLCIIVTSHSTQPNTLGVGSELESYPRDRTGLTNKDSNY